MHFRVNNSWEIVDPVFAALGDVDARRYRIIESTLNSNQFLLDVVREEGGQYASFRYHVAFIKDILGLIASIPAQNFQLALLSRRCDNNGSYSVSDIDEIIECKDEYGQCNYIYRCVDGNQYSEFGTVSSEIELKDKKTVYRRS